MDYALSKRPPPGAIHRLWNGTPLYALTAALVSLSALTLSPSPPQLSTNSARPFAQVQSAPVLACRQNNARISEQARAQWEWEWEEMHELQERQRDGRRPLHSATRRGNSASSRPYRVWLSATPLHPDSRLGVLCSGPTQTSTSFAPSGGRLGLQRWEVPCEWSPSPTFTFASLSVLPLTASNPSPSSRSVTPPRTTYSHGGAHLCPGRNNYLRIRAYGMCECSRICHPTWRDKEDNSAAKTCTGTGITRTAHASVRLCLCLCRVDVRKRIASRPSGSASSHTGCAASAKSPSVVRAAVARVVLCARRYLDGICWML
ncbi:hypothetical protein C8F01DRAFT_174385 [Mycena amicta]|nr:hypothetical protein C8F01DRAFT_174385 [Mycena amicta]